MHYPILGHVFHKIMLDAADIEDKEFYRNLNPLTPIINCNGLTCMEGLWDVPAFNTDGKIVGFLLLSNSCSTILIHVTILKKFFDECRLDKKETSQHDGIEVCSVRFQIFIQQSKYPLLTQHCFLYRVLQRKKALVFQSIILDMQDN